MKSLKYTTFTSIKLLDVNLLVRITSFLLCYSLVGISAVYPNSTKIYSDREPIKQAPSATCRNYTTSSIADNSNSSTAVSTITNTGSVGVMGAGTEITSVCVLIEHPYIGDLRIRLYCPDGIFIELANQINSTSDNYGVPSEPTEVCFTSDAATSILGYPGNTAGDYLPQNLLSGLNGCTANGDWQLFVWDHKTGDVGNLLSWSIEFDNGYCSAINVSTNSTSVSCNGLSDGTATVMVSGGTSAYTYNWSNGEVGPTAGYLESGSHTIQVTDANGYGATATVVITEPDVLSATITASTNVSCNGLSNGTATVTVTGGTTAYTYNWSNNEVTATASMLGAGTHSVQVTDGNGCTATATVIITEPDLLTSTIIASTDVSCNGLSDGTATVAVTGGTTAYTYVWYNGEIGSTATSLGAGPHSVVVTDANGCTATATVEIIEPDIFTASITASDNVSCSGLSDGTATVAVTGGTTAYIYVWDNSEITATATSLGAGSHSVIVTDANSCTTTATVEITEPALLSATITASTDVSCNGLSDASATVSVSGGITAYTYVWDNNETTATATSLGAGIHSVVVTDANGCTATTSAGILDPAPFLASAAGGALSCNGDTDGSITLSLTGGSFPYVYVWDNGLPPVQNPSGLGAGIYNVTVTDANGCTATAQAEITEPDLLTATINQSTNSATAIGNGGITSYSYNWSNGGTTASISNLAVGSYVLTVTDANACIATASTNIQQNCNANAGTHSMVNDTTICYGEAFSIITNGDWGGNHEDGSSNDSPANGGDGDFFNGIIYGIYSAPPTTENAMIDPALISLAGYSPIFPGGPNEPSAVLVNDGSQPALQPNTPYYATTIYSFDHNELFGPVVATYPPISTSICADVNLTGYTKFVFLEDITVTCVQTCDNGKIDISCNISGGLPAYDGSMYEVTGDGPSGVFLPNNGAYVINDFSPNTSYSFTVLQTNGCSKSFGGMSMDIVLANALAITGTSCNGTSDGSATVTTSGGQAPYIYQWDNNETTSTAVALTAGTHNVTVSDASACTVTAQVLIQEPLLLSVGIGQVMGNSATASASGGTSPYIYAWNSGGNMATVNNLPSGINTVTVTDNNACTATATVSIQPDFSATTTPIVNISCNGSSDGRAVVNPSGGTAPYTYLWENGENTQTAYLLSAETTGVTIYDNIGNIAFADVIINEPAALTPSIATTGVSCNNTDGTATVTVTGGTSGYTYVWNNGEVGATITGLNIGTYNLTVSDANACTATSSVEVFNQVGISPEELYGPPPITTCSSVPLTFYVVDPNGGLPNHDRYVFFIDGIVVQDGSSFILTANNLQSGVLSVVAYEGNCALDIPNQKTINIYQEPEISLCNPSANTLQITLTQGSPPWTFDLVRYQGNFAIDTASFLVFNTDTTINTVSNITYEVQNLGLDSDNCVYTDIHQTGQIEGCSAICMGYNEAYTETFTANFSSPVSAVQWTISPLDATQNGDVEIIGGSNNQILEVDFSNPAPFHEKITLEAVGNTTCGTEILSFELILDPECVWPGDVNLDGQVDINSNIRWIDDELGLEFARTEYAALNNGQTGQILHTKERLPGCLATSTSDWEPQSALDWEKEDSIITEALFPIKDGIDNIVNTFNLKHADCNGNMEIETDQNWEQTFNVPFNTVSNPTDHDLIIYHAINNEKHNGNAHVAKQNNYPESLHVEAPDSVTQGDQVVFTVYLGADNDTIKGVHHISLVGEGEFGDYYRPAVSTINSHLSAGSSEKLVDYPFLHDDFNGYENDSLRWHISLSRPESLSYGVDFRGEEVCNLTCHMTVAEFQNSPDNLKQNGAAIPVTFKIPVAGLILDDGSYIYVQAAVDTIWVLPNPILNARVFLEGPFVDSIRLMRDDLRLKGQIPATEPFTALGYNFQNEEVIGLGMTDSSAVLSVSGQDAIVDWVLIEVRYKNDPDSIISARPALLTRHGEVVEMDGKSRPTLWRVPQDEHYVVIHHRNHLPAMTSTPVMIDHTEILIDFVDQNAYVGSGTGQIKIGPDLWAMAAGDFDQSLDMNGTDNVIWSNENGNTYCYKMSDANLDAQVDGLDKILWSKNNGMFSMVPK